MNKIQRAKVVSTLRTAAERMAERGADGMCSAVLCAFKDAETHEMCLDALFWLRRDSPRWHEAYWYAMAYGDFEARAFALDMLASIIEAGDTLDNGDDAC
jgi:hypothetical protein